ncbi:MAG: hypothetical protein H6575_00740 [Lewinellaceae bacterium]|nr:hypothetical protein [Lewinellaceae bacterium]
MLSTIILNILLSIAVERIIHVVIRPAMNFLLKKKYKWDPQRSFYDSLLSIPKIITIIKPKILLASGIVWTFLFASKIDILWSMDFKITPIKSALMLAIVISAYFFMMAKLSAVVIRPKGASKFIELTKRGVLVLILASTYSFIIGMLGMSYYAKKSLSDETRKMSYKTNYLSVFDTSSHALLWYPRSQNTNEKQLLVSRDLLCASLIRNNFHQKFDSLFFNTQLPNIYRDGTLNKKVCYSHNFNVPLEKDLPLTFFLFATTDPLIFFTFITVAVGILLEMGLRIEDTGINLD